MSQPMSQQAEAPPKQRKNPYVGPRAFRKDELFFGREAEKEGLLDKLLPGGVTLLYAPSGAGKTSLIQAAVVPELLDQGFQVCAASSPRFSALRVNLPPPAGLAIENPYVFSIVNGLVGAFVTPAEAARFSIEDALDLFAANGPVGRDVDEWAGQKDDALRGQSGSGRRAPQQVVVIDQLEEVLTLDPNDTHGRAEFFHQLGHALRRGRRWALLSMREDYVGQMDRYKRYFQNELRTTYRLDYLDEDAAMRAVQEPAAARHVTFQEDAARQLITDLRRVRADHPLEVVPRPGQQLTMRRKVGSGPATDRRHEVVPGVSSTAGARGPGQEAARRPPAGATALDDVPGQRSDSGGQDPTAEDGTSSGTDEPVVYPYVEPVLLQVVCDNLWRVLSKKKPDFTRITAADLAEVKPYHGVLSKYYRSVVREAAAKNSDTERAIRDWVEQHLLTKQGLRRPTLTPPKVRDRDFVMVVLQQRYLIRDDPRPGGTWWELAHDMLVQPVIQDNRAWQLSNLAAWQVVADEWHRTGRPRDLLLQNSDLREAKSAAKKTGITWVEEEFLQESIRVAEEAGRYRNLLLQRDFFRVLVGLSLCLNAYLVLRFLVWR